MMNTDKTYAEKIASEYAPKETRKVVALRKLDNRAKRPANIFAYTFGTVMSLLLGVKPYNTAKYGFNVHTAVIQAPFMKSRPRSIYLSIKCIYSSVIRPATSDRGVNNS